MAVAGAGRKEVLRLLVPKRPHGQPAPMRSGAHASVISILPVGEVMSAFLPRPGMVADFVSRHSGSRRHCVGQLVEGSRRIWIERLESMLCDHAGEACARFNG